MIFTSCIPALDMLIIPLDPLSKPVGPIFFNDRYLGVSLNRVGLSWLHGSLLNPSRYSVPAYYAVVATKAVKLTGTRAAKIHQKRYLCHPKYKIKNYSKCQ